MGRGPDAPGFPWPTAGLASRLDPAGILPRLGEVFAGAERAPPLPLPRHGKTRLLPGGHSPFEGLGVGVSRLDQHGRLTGGAAFVGSGAIEDDFPVPGQGGPEGLELLQRDGALQVDLPEPGVAVIGADQERCS